MAENSLSPLNISIHCLNKGLTISGILDNLCIDIDSLGTDMPSYRAATSRLKNIGGALSNFSGAGNCFWSFSFFDNLRLVV